MSPPRSASCGGDKCAQSHDVARKIKVPLWRTFKHLKLDNCIGKKDEKIVRKARKQVKLIG